MRMLTQCSGCMDILDLISIYLENMGLPLGQQSYLKFAIHVRPLQVT